MAAIQEGKTAPAFTLEDANGKKVSLESFAGKNVILYFYPKDDTPGCTKEACGFRDSWKDIQKANAIVLGVSADAASRTRSSSRSTAPVPAALGSRPQDHEDVRRLRREDDVRKEDDRGHSVYRMDRSGREGAEALGPGGRCCEASGSGAGGAAGRGLAQTCATASVLVSVASRRSVCSNTAST